MTRLCASLGIVVFLSACDNFPSLPTAPTSMPAALAPPPGSTYTIFGVVRTGNAPVSGARAAVLDQDYFAPVTTDGDGRYSIRASSAQPWGMSPLVAASRPGYFADIKFTDTDYQPISKDTQLDFELDPLVQISVGEVVRGRVGGGTCSHWGYGGNRSCARFAFTAPTSGTLEVTVSAPMRDFDVDIVRPDGTFALYNPVWLSLSRDRITVEGGATYQIRLTGPSPREFEVTAVLR